MIGLIEPRERIVRMLRMHRKNKNDYPWGMLHPDARLVLGMMYHTDATMKQIAAELEVRVGDVRKFIAHMRRDEICSWVIENGIPASFGAYLEQPVRCTRCDRRMVFAPCVVCCTFEGAECRNDREQELKIDDRFTHAVPGSDEKIRVMRDRADRGVQIFHPNDLMRDDKTSLVNP